MSTKVLALVDLVRPLPLRVLAHLLGAFWAEGKKTPCLLLFPAAPSDLQAPGFSLVRFEALQEQRQEHSQGVMVAFQGIDLVNEDILTKGTRFYPLEEVLLSLGCHQVLRQSWKKLGALVCRLDKTSNFKANPKRRRKIAGLFLPAIMDDYYENTGFFPLHLSFKFKPDHPENPIHQPDLVGPNDLASLQAHMAEPDREERLEIGFGALFQGRTPPSFDIRRILQKNEWLEGQGFCLERLVHFFAAEWSKETRAELWLERLLLLGRFQGTYPSSTDLVAVYISDLEAFLKGMPAVFIYRKWPESMKTAAAQMVDLDSFLQQPQPTGGIIFALRPIKQLFGGREVEDLGGILEKAHLGPQLIFTTLLLLQDLAGKDMSPRVQNVDAYWEDLIETAIHLCTLVGLDAFWRFGPRQHKALMDGAYRVLDSLLQQMVNLPEKGIYYRSLRFWFSCYRLAAGKIDQGISLMTAAEVQTWPSEKTFGLKRLFEALAHILDRGAQPEVIKAWVQVPDEDIHAGVTDLREDGAYLNRENKIPSQLFMAHYVSLVELLAEKHRCLHTPMREADRTQALKMILAKLDHLKRTVYALPHEMQVLDHLLEFVSRDIQTTVVDLGGRPRLAVQCLTNLVLNGEESPITFLLSNIGKGDAQDVVVSLVLNQGFTLKDASIHKRIALLGAGNKQDLVYKMIPDTPELVLRLKVAFQSDGEKKEFESPDFRIEVPAPFRGTFERMSNPYQAGNPIAQPDRFFGREEEIKALVSHFAGDAAPNIWIRAVRRMGKTSVLYLFDALIRDRDGGQGLRRRFGISPYFAKALDRLEPILFDLQSLPDKNLGGFYRYLLQRIASLGFASPNLTRALAMEELEAYVVSAVLNALSVQFPQRKLVFLLDELETLDKFTERSSASHLRHIITNSQAGGWVVASATGLDKEIASYGSPLFNVFNLIRLGPLSSQEATALILKSWEKEKAGGGACLHFHPLAIEEILKESGCFPYFLQLLCVALVAHANRHKSNECRLDAVQEVARKLSDPEGEGATHFDYLWHGVDPLGRQILLNIMKRGGRCTAMELTGFLDQDFPGLGFGQLGSRNPNVPLNASIAALTQLGIITWREDRFLDFSLPLFRRVLLHLDNRNQLERPTREGIAAHLQSRGAP